LELNKNPENYFAKVEQAAFNPANVVPGKLFRLMSPAQQKALFENTARAIGDAPKEIKLRHIGNCLKADPAYGKGVANACGISLREAPK
jgi:catalase